MPQSVGADPFVTTVIDSRYLVLRRIGVGATAAVYCAQDLVLGRQVAIKRLHDWFADDDEIVERFRREASIASGLHDPHIVSVYGSGEWEGSHYIVLEHVAGPSLRSLMRRGAPLAPARAIKLTMQLLLAVRYIHRRGIVHRDLKPANVILGASGELKLTDFGIARFRVSETTDTGVIVGTAHYLSPEQVEGEAASVASDLYSIGVILYELLAGRVPFEADTIAAVLLSHLRDQPVPPSALQSGVTPELDAISLRALAKNPHARFANADAFIAALQDVATGVPADSFTNLTQAARGDSTRAEVASTDRRLVKRPAVVAGTWWWAQNDAGPEGESLRGALAGSVSESS